MPDQSPKSKRGPSAGATASALATIAALSIRLTGQVSSDQLARIAAVAMLVWGILYGGRVIVRVYMGYWQYTPKRSWPWTERQRRALSALLVADGVLSLALIAVGCWFIAESPGTWLQIGVSSALATFVAASAHSTLKLARAGGLRRGTDAVFKCRAVRWLRENMKIWKSFPGVAKLDSWLWARTSKDQVSGLVMVIVLGLALMPLANAAGAIQIVLQTPEIGTQTTPTTTTAPTATTATTPPPAATTTVAKPAPPPPARQLSYEDLCGAVPPARGAANDQQQNELERAWRLIGAIVAGCRGSTQLVAGTDDTYYVLGQCGGNPFPSVAVTSPEHPAVVLLEGWATFAKEMITAGRLRGASAHVLIGSGDFQIVYTDAGAYILIRREISDGQGGFRHKPQSCADLEPATQAPVRLPPGLADLWLRYAQRYKQPSWPVRNPALDRNGRRAFEFRSADGRNARIAVGSCAGPTECELHSSTVSWRSMDHEAEPLTTDRVLSFGPR
jgi:hypothetical protein